MIAQAGRSGETEHAPSACVGACARMWPPFIIAADDTLKPDAFGPYPSVAS